MNNTQTNKLEKFQYSAIRFSLGYRRTTPTNILLAESKLPLISERAIFLCKNYLMKILSHNNLQISSTILEKYLNSSPSDTKKRLLRQCIQQITEYTPYLYKNDTFNIFNTNFETAICKLPTPEKTQKSDSTTSNNADSHDNYCSQTVRVYTDGSKKTEGQSVGAAYYCPQLDFKKKISISPTASVYTAECLAINEAMNIVITYPDYSYQIINDSLSAIECISRPSTAIKTSEYIIDIKTKYNIFLDLNNGTQKIEFIWIRSHTGDPGNEEADRLAGEATQEAVDPRYYLPFADFRAIFKQNSFENTVNFIREMSNMKGKEYFDIYHSDKKKPWFHGLNLSRKIISWVNRSRANHYNLNSSLYRVNIVSSPACQCGFSDQNLDHIFWHCPEFTEDRKNMINKLSLLGHKVPYNIKTFLRTLEIPVLKILNEFLTLCNIDL